jgi:hypothetical protein
MTAATITTITEAYRWCRDANHRIEWMLREKPEYAKRRVWLLRHIARHPTHYGSSSLCGEIVWYGVGQRKRGQKTIACTACVERYEAIHEHAQG